MQDFPSIKFHRPCLHLRKLWKINWYYLRWLRVQYSHPANFQLVVLRKSWEISEDLKKKVWLIFIKNYKKVHRKFTWKPKAMSPVLFTIVIDPASLKLRLICKFCAEFPVIKTCPLCPSFYIRGFAVLPLHFRESRAMRVTLFLLSLITFVVAQCPDPTSTAAVTITSDSDYMRYTNCTILYLVSSSSTNPLFLWGVFFPSLFLWHSRKEGFLSSQAALTAALCCLTQ